MSTKSPRSRLQKLFQKSPSPNAKPKSEVPTESHPPPVTHEPIKKKGSRASLRDVFHGKGRSSSVSKDGRASIDSPASPEAQAAAKAAYTSDETPPRLPSLPQSSQLSNDFQGLKIGSDGSPRATSSPKFSSNSPSSPSYPPSSSEGEHNLARKGHVTNLRTSGDIHDRSSAFQNPRAAPSPTTATFQSPRAAPSPTTHRPLSREKPYPKTPSDEYTAEREAGQPAPKDSQVHSLAGTTRGYAVHDSATPIDPTSIVDLSSTEDTTLHEQWAPAVTHETITQNVHHIREERITREIHHHHVFHRVQPIIDIEVLPARHFIPMADGYAEIAASDVPGRAGDNAQWLIAETASRSLPTSKFSTDPKNAAEEIKPEPLRFTARTFTGEEGQPKSYISPLGHPVTEQTWIHPPTLEMGGYETGQTYAFGFGAEDASMNGLQATLVGGKKIVGISPALLKERREAAEAAELEAGKKTGQGVVPVSEGKKAFL